MFTILIIGDNLLPVETIQSPINPIGAKCITTEKAHYYITEFSVDFKKGHIVAQADPDIYYFGG